VLVRAIMSPQRAAQLVRYTDREGRSLFGFRRGGLRLFDAAREVRLLREVLVRSQPLGTLAATRSRARHHRSRRAPGCCAHWGHADQVGIGLVGPRFLVQRRAISARSASVCPQLQWQPGSSADRLRLERCVGHQHLESQPSVADAPLCGSVAASVPSRAIWFVAGSFAGPYNHQMEPTRLAGCAIMSLTRAAHLAR
jgi:hypothetical protein